jgi:ATP-dependent exoDNAse (exonuclease V) alpha subunit
VQVPVILSKDFNDIIDQLEYSKEHFFITGRAGTGKSTLLNIFRNTTKKKVVVLAPTGIAALNVKGQTIHSFFGLPPRLIQSHEIEKRKNTQVFKKVETIIIDEISMVRADIMDHINYILQMYRQNNLPFGGVQMIFFGDLFQLPPVIATTFERNYFKTHYQSPYFFSSAILQQLHLQILQLQHVYRQEEKRFIRLLDGIRTNTIDYEDLAEINERYVPIPENKDFYITLTSRNDTAHKINEEALRLINEPEYEYGAYIEGEFNPQLFPTEHRLRLKTGAQVMLIKNDLEKQYVNGTIGKIKDLSTDYIRITIPDGSGSVKDITIDKHDWEILRYEQDRENPDKITTKVVGIFRQYPVKLAWAITIHKSQGKTFDKVIIDMAGGAFESGQSYVALSRCRTLQGIILKNPLKPRDIIVDPDIVEYYEQCRYLS